MDIKTPTMAQAPTGYTPYTDWQNDSGFVPLDPFTPSASVVTHYYNPNSGQYFSTGSPAFSQLPEGWQQTAAYDRIPAFTPPQTPIDTTPAPTPAPTPTSPVTTAPTTTAPTAPSPVSQQVGGLASLFANSGFWGNYMPSYGMSQYMGGYSMPSYNPNPYMGGYGMTPFMPSYGMNPYMGYSMNPYMGGGSPFGYGYSPYSGGIGSMASSFYGGPMSPLGLLAMFRYGQ